MSSRESHPLTVKEHPDVVKALMGWGLEIHYAKNAALQSLFTGFYELFGDLPAAEVNMKPEVELEVRRGVVNVGHAAGVIPQLSKSKCR